MERAEDRRVDKVRVVACRDANIRACERHCEWVDGRVDAAATEVVTDGCCKLLRDLLLRSDRVIAVEKVCEQTTQSRCEGEDLQHARPEPVLVTDERLIQTSYEKTTQRQGRV